MYHVCRTVPQSFYIFEKLPSISDEKFHEHWKNQHVDTAKGNQTFMSKTRKYNQVHITPELRAQAEAFNIPVMEYDGIAEVWIDSVEEWKAIAADENFISVIPADEDLFIQKPFKIQFSYDNLVIPEK
ncbi:hypothetical protein EJ08DRAFT_728661 [Tothia fuscella]|uniref:EthD domain-containing protein n=1 Tax=Tothia fuscella TaxID=1048955 RepID=A0A9P4P3W8_9PEZI|nr:hypothetical protein EJ08DRAFT_728661 [Tothia fuscella]